MSYKIKKIKQIILLITIICSCTCKIDISSGYEYPKPTDTNYFRIAVFGSNDLHGGIFPKRYPDSNGVRFSFGGGINLYSYVKILREEWGKQFLWLDAGDQFQGSLECMLSNGTVMSDFYSFAKTDGLAIGNHDFDYGPEKLKEHIKTTGVPYLGANMYDKVQKKYIYDEGMWEGTYPYQIYSYETGTTTISIGVIGLGTKQTHSTTSGDTSFLDFEDYYETTVKYAKELKEEKKVNAVLLLTHFGPKCNEEEKMELKMYKATDTYKECEQAQEIMDLIRKLAERNPDLVDGIVSGHVHDVVHHWIEGIPVVESSGSEYFNVMYLAFDSEGKLVKDKIEIEGPVPVCEKIWADTNNCVYKYSDSSVMEEFMFHTKDVVPDEELVAKMDYWKKIIDENEKTIITNSEIDLFLDGTKETALTNLVNDVNKIITNSDFCFYNLGGIRSNWVKGPINKVDMFYMFPFNNTLVSFEMTGEEVIHMFKNLAGSTIYPSSGNLQTFTYTKKTERYDMKDFLVFDGINEYPIELGKTYRVCTNDFLAEGGSAMGKVRQWYKELRNRIDHGTVREETTKFLTLMETIKEEHFINPNYPRITVIDV